MNPTEHPSGEIDFLEYKNKPTKPTREYKLVHTVRDTRDLCDETEESVYVHQNHANISKNGEALNSDGFVFCSGVLIHNLDTNEVFLAHVPNWKLSDEQYADMEKLGKGNYKIVVLAGKKSLFTKKTLLNEEISEFVGRFTRSTGRNILFSDDIIVNSGDGGWSVSYKPHQRLFKIYTSQDKTVREYPL